LDNKINHAGAGLAPAPAGHADEMAKNGAALGEINPAGASWNGRRGGGGMGGGEPWKWAGASLGKWAGASPARTGGLSAMLLPKRRGLLFAQLSGLLPIGASGRQIAEALLGQSAEK
jgi:hypothetical protein